MIEDMDDSIGKVEEKNNRVESLSSNTTGVSSTTPPLVQPSHSSNIIERTMMQKTVFHVYPNGQMYIQPSQSKAWFNDSLSVYKKKTKKKGKAPTKIKIGKEESY